MGNFLRSKKGWRHGEWPAATQAHHRSVIKNLARRMRPAAPHDTLPGKRVQTLAQIHLNYCFY
jgi:hypothetical protein